MSLADLNLPFSDYAAYVLMVILTLLVCATAIFKILSRLRPNTDLTYILQQINSWWVMYFFALVMFFLGKKVAFFGVGLVSFIALREVLSAVELRHNDRYAIFWAYLSIPIQYYFAYIGNIYLFLIFIPVIMFLVIPVRTMLQGESAGIIKSMAIVQWMLMLTVFTISHIAFLLSLKLNIVLPAGNTGLLLYLILLSQLNDIAQFTWGKIIGGKEVSPRISPDKTWAGFIGGIITTMITAYLLRFLTPFTVLQSLVLGFLIALAGFGGDINIKAIKKDLGIKKFGNIIPGQGGILDRIDSLCFSSLVFFHLVYFWYSGN